jgi:hypothetical protein
MHWPVLEGRKTYPYTFTKYFVVWQNMFVPGPAGSIIDSRWNSHLFHFIEQGKRFSRGKIVGLNILHFFTEQVGDNGEKRELARLPAASGFSCR